MRSTRIVLETTVAMVLTLDMVASVAMETVPPTDPILMVAAAALVEGKVASVLFPCIQTNYHRYGGYSNSPAPPTPGGAMSPTTTATPGGMNPAAYTPEYIAQVQAYYNQTGSDPYAAYGRPKNILLIAAHTNEHQVVSLLT